MQELQDRDGHKITHEPSVNELVVPLVVQEFHKRLRQRQALDAHLAAIIRHEGMARKATLRAGLKGRGTFYLPLGSVCELCEHRNCG